MMKSKIKIPKLSKRVLNEKVKKQDAKRIGFSTVLRKLSKNENLEKIYGQEFCARLGAISKFDTVNGILNQQEKRDIKKITSIINETSKKHLGTKIDFLSAKELGEAIKTGDPSGLLNSTSNAILSWKSQLSENEIRALEWASIKNHGQQKITSTFAENMVNFESDSPLSDGALAGLAFIGGGLVIVPIIGIIQEIASWFSGSSVEKHRYAFSFGKIETTSLLHVPWRGFDCGDNNQIFYSQYAFESIDGNSFDEVKVRHRIRLMGGGFDRLKYPIEAYAWNTQNGYQKIDPRPKETTRYNQIHEFTFSNTRWFAIRVNPGKVYYGSDGCMTCAALVPDTRIIHNGISRQLPSGQSIWQYGWSF